MKPEDFAEDGRFAVGRVVGCKNATYEALRTEAPSRFTQADLIDEMMNAHKYATNDTDRALLRSIAGLGTSRTREAMITGQIDRGLLIEEKAKRSRSRVEIKPSENAMIIVGYLPKLLTDPATTAKWELAFQMLEKGKVQLPQIQAYFAALLKEIVDSAKGNIGQIQIKAAAPKGVVSNHFSKTPQKGVVTSKAAVTGGK
jgi:DNA topoisomerase-3